MVLLPETDLDAARSVAQRIHTTAASGHALTASSASA
jgi:PleD family two-component response regulator